MAQIIIAYVPVIHEGYRQLLAKYPAAKLYLLGRDISDQYRPLVKEVRALEPQLIVKMITALDSAREVEVLSQSSLEQLAPQTPISLIMPDEDVSHDLAEKYFKTWPIIFEKVFLRWDKHRTTAEVPVIPSQKISRDQFDRQMIGLAETEGEKSSDWWRQIGAVASRDGQVLLQTHNHHLPSDHTPYIDGDPRGSFNKGVNLELSTAIHAEAALVAEAAKCGLSLAGADLYVSTFPCPPCAKLVAGAGFKRLFYTGYYGVLDGERSLKDADVEIIFVEPENK